jgi:hypothetical protein
MQYFSDGRNKLIRVHYDDDVTTMEQMHAFSDAKAEGWSARDGWQPSPTATSDILQSGWLERIADSEVPAEQARMRVGQPLGGLPAARVVGSGANELKDDVRYQHIASGRDVEIANQLSALATKRVLSVVSDDQARRAERINRIRLISPGGAYSGG